eukprot:12912046-Prorocentrum_lima.AAC.1
MVQSAAAALASGLSPRQGGPPTLTTLQRSMYPARQQPPVVDLTQPDPESDSAGDDAPVDRPEDPPELDEPDDMQGLINAGRCVPAANQE